MYPLSRGYICFCMCLFAVTLMVPSTPLWGAAGNGRAITIDDMMRVEGYGAAVGDPSGRWVIFERIRPYDQFSDYSFRTYAFSKSGHQLWRYDLRGAGEPELVPGIDPEPHSYQQGFSPSGRFLAVMKYRFGELSLGAYDMTRERLVEFEPTPAFSRAGEHNPVWISDEELVFAASPDGQWPPTTSVRAYAGRMLTRAWDAAWRGKQVTASEVRTVPDDHSDQQEVGYLVRVNALTGRADKLAEGLYADLRVSSDGRWLAAMAVSKPRPMDADKLVQEDARRYSLAVFDLQTHQMKPLARGLEFFPYTIAWAPDNRRLAAFGWTDGEGPRDGRFYVIDVTTGEVVRYDHRGLDLASERERGWLQRPERTSFLGEGLVVFARRIPEGEDQAPRLTYQDMRPTHVSKPDWHLLRVDGSSTNLTYDLPGVSGVPVHAGKGQFTVWADDGVYRLFADGKRRSLTSGLVGKFRFNAPGTFATREGVIRPEFADEALFDVTGSGVVKIVMVDLREGRESAVVVDTPVQDATPLAGSVATGSVLFRAEDGPTSRLLLGSSVRQGQPREIDAVNTHLGEIDFGTWQVVSYPFRDREGRAPTQTIESCILLPPGYRHEAPLPLLVEVYPDVGPSCKRGGPKISYPDPHSPYLWAGRGYAYARITTPRALIRTQDGPIAGMDEVIEAGVDAFVKEGLVDPDRLAVYGFSQGGISALYTAAHSPRFKAVISMNGWADLFSHYFGSSGIYSYAYGEYFGDFARYDSVSGSDFGIGQTPFENPEIYYRNSGVFLAPRIQAPVLLIHSDMDSFSMSQFDEMYGALLRAGKDARYVRYMGEGHGPSSPANVRDMWERQLSFLREQGVSP